MIECFLAALRLGLTAFGGPVAHIGFMRDEYVTRRGWVSEERFAELMALCHFIPGPGSSQLGAAIGYERGRLPGAIAAWVGFTLPSALVMIAVALGVTHLAGDWMPGVLRGLKLVAIAVVANAWLGMRSSLSPDWQRSLLALGALALLWFFPQPWVTLAVIIAGATVSIFFLKSGTSAVEVSDEKSGPKSSTGLVWLLVFAVLLAVSYFPGSSSQPLAALGGIYQAGALVFGGGHVVLPILETAMVDDWMDRESFLGGYGAAQAVPGPLFTFAAYLGARIPLFGNAWLGGAAALVALFLPGMLLLAGTMTIWSRLRQKAWAQKAVMGANAVVVGVLGVALLRMATGGALSGWIDAALVVVAFLFLFFGKITKVPVWLIVILGGLAGVFLP